MKCPKPIDEAEWTTNKGPVENCNTLSYAGKKMYRCGGKDFMIMKGAPKNL